MTGLGLKPAQFIQLGQRVRAHREALQLSRSALARLAKLSESTVRNIERGREVTAATLKAIAAGLGTRLEDLLDLEDRSRNATLVRMVQVLQQEEDRVRQKAQALQAAAGPALAEAVAADPAALAQAPPDPTLAEAAANLQAVRVLMDRLAAALGVRIRPAPGPVPEVPQMADVLQPAEARCYVCSGPDHLADTCPRVEQLRVPAQALVAAGRGLEGCELGELQRVLAFLWHRPRRDERPACGVL